MPGFQVKVWDFALLDRKKSNFTFFENANMRTFHVVRKSSLQNIKEYFLQHHRKYFILTVAFL